MGPGFPCADGSPGYRKGVVHTFSVQVVERLPPTLHRLWLFPGSVSRGTIAGPIQKPWTMYHLWTREDCLMLSRLHRFAVDFLRGEDGPTAVEYAVMLALIIVVCIGAITILGQNANSTFTGVGNAIGSSSS